MSEHGSSKKSIRSEFTVVDTIWMLMGITCATIGLEGFIVPNGLLDGGVTGISLMCAKIFHMDVSIFIFVINIPFIILGYKQVSPAFAFKTFGAIIILSIVLLLLHNFHFPKITDDRLLIAVFGGFFLGAGIGLAMRGGSVIDGTEVLALYLTRKTSLAVGDIILLINILIFGVAAALYGIESALYSILTYMAATKTIAFITEGVEEYTGVIIISEHSDKIRKQIIQTLGRGVTIFNGKRGLRGKKAQAEGLNDRDILYTVVTKLELSKIKHILAEIDDSCFMTTHSINSVKGGMVKQRKLH
jgi:uncharacterized membrane-anchored protein YitT (DUF2179 family)